MPSASQLPQELAPLAELNALKLRDGDWEADVAKIVQRLERLGIKRLAAPDPPLTTTKRSAKAIWSLAVTALVVIGLANGENDEDTIIGALALSAVALGLAASLTSTSGSAKPPARDLRSAGSWPRSWSR